VLLLTGRKKRAEKLAEVMKRMNAGWLTDIEQKSFDLQISVIKSAKINRYFEMQDNYQIQMQSLLNQQIKKRESIG
jgi:hypothetical protein